MNKKNLEKLIFQLNRERNIFLLGFKKNIIPILKNSLFFTLTSEWEDPGFVIIESMFFNTLVYSSDCKNGPVDLIQNQENGFLFKKNDQNDYIKKFCKIYEMINKKNKSINKIKYNAKQKTKLYTLLYHYKNLDRILN